TGAGRYNTSVPPSLARFILCRRAWLGLKPSRAGRYNTSVPPSLARFVTQQSWAVQHLRTAELGAIPLYGGDDV
ncbi:MAG: hypothetical protein N3D16_02950, partial [Anaerolineales bacterium]|nr:hypothetical protein [Anaerolineales bacterium]